MKHTRNPQPGCRSRKDLFERSSYVTTHMSRTKKYFESTRYKYKVEDYYGVLHSSSSNARSVLSRYTAAVAGGGCLVVLYVVYCELLPIRGGRGKVT